MLFINTKKEAAIRLLDELEKSISELEISILSNRNHAVSNSRIHLAKNHVTSIRAGISVLAIDSTHYIKCKENEIEHEFSFFIKPLIKNNHVIILAFLGRMVDYRCKDSIEKVTRESVKTIVLPTNNNDSIIRICVLVSNNSYLNLGGEIDDSAILLLQHYE